MSKKQKIYTPEFRQQLVELALAGRKPNELALEFGCHVTSLQSWIKQSQICGNSNRSSAVSAEAQELIQLRKENKQLRLERDILSKATAWFASNGAPTSTPSTR